MSTEVDGDGSSGNMPEPDAAGRIAGVVPPLPILVGPVADTTYQSLSGIARTTKILLAVTAGGTLLTAVGYFMPQPNLIATIASLVYVFVGTPALVMYFIWFYRAHKNLAALNARNTSFSDAMAVGGYFIPFVNLVRPYHVMAEVWKGSDPDGDVTDPTAWKGASIPPVLVAWWTIQVISNVTIYVILSTKNGPLIGAAELFRMGMPLLTVVLITKITTRQELRYARLVGEPLAR